MAGSPVQGRGGAKGFTLIELMIVVAIVAILAAIAYPSFVDQVRKSRRAQAKADLLELAQLAERYRTVNNTYAGYALPFDQSPRTGTARYQIQQGGTWGTSTFELSATPLDGQAGDPCGTLGVDQANRKTADDAAGVECW